MHSVVLVYVRSLKLFNKPTKIDATIPYSFAKFNGLYKGEDAERFRNGFGDPIFRISMILIGDQPLLPKEFAQRKISKFKLGVALKIRPPLGQYDNTKFINLGANRWAFDK